MKKKHSENYRENTNAVEPRKETIEFILKYSEALHIINYNNLQFEVVLN